VSGKGEQSAACPIACGERIRRRVGPELENYYAPKFGARRIGAGPNVAGEHRPQLGQELRGRLRGCNVRNMNPGKAEALSPELERALEPLLSAI